jgi:hypothetical protein
VRYGHTCFVKTTLDIQDVLLLRAKRLSKRTGKPLRALVEEGLQHVLSNQSGRSKTYLPPDCSVGDPSAPNPLESWSWQDLRDEIYGEPGRR